MRSTTKRVVISLAMTLLVLQYVLSGFQKILFTRSCKDADLMKGMLGDRCVLNMTVLILAGIWELAASAAALYTTYTDTHEQLRMISLLSLAVFTVLATLMFKVWPKVKYYGLISNVAVTGGLVLASVMPVA